MSLIAGGAVHPTVALFGVPFTRLYFVPVYSALRGQAPILPLRITALCLVCDQGRRAGHCGLHRGRYAQRLPATLFGLARQLPFRVTGPSGTAARDVAVRGTRACVRLPRSGQAAAAWDRQHPVSRTFVVPVRCSERPTYLIHVGPTSRSLPGSAFAGTALKLKFQWSLKFQILAVSVVPENFENRALRTAPCAKSQARRTNSAAGERAIRSSGIVMPSPAAVVRHV
jgi:hypothetical protein